MTVSSAVNRKTFTGDGVTTSFATTPLKFFDTSDLQVYVTTDATGVTVLKTEGTHYTVSGGDASAGAVGTVSLAGGSSPHGALLSGTTLVILRELPLLQGVDFVQNDASNAEVAEAALDKLAMNVQRLDDRLDRSLVVSDGDVSGADFTVPTPVASKLLGWSSTGLALQLYASATLLDSVIPSAFMETVLDDGNGATVMATLYASQGEDEHFQLLIDGMTAETAPAIGDIIALSDVSLTPDNGRKMTLENMLKVVNGLTADLAPDRAADYILSYDASAGAAKKVLMDQFPLPRSYLAGGTISNNGADATNDLDFAAGEARDSTNAVNIRWSALTKQLDAVFAAGTNAGMLDTGVPSNTTYHLFAIRKDSDGTGDILASTSASAPTMPSGYTYFRRIGSIPRVSAALAGISQRGNEFVFKAAPAVTTTTTLSTTAQLLTLAVPIGIQVTALYNLQWGDADGATYGYISSPDQNDEAASGSIFTIRNSAGAAAAEVVPGGMTRTNTSGQVRAVSAGGTGNSALTILPWGWIDTRGRDD